MKISVDDLVRHIFRIKYNSIYEENLARYTLVKQRTIDRIKDAHLSPYIVPVPERKNVSLKEAIDDAVRQTVKASKGKQLVLLWSGGIDSTLVFCALVQHKVPFTVYMDERSIAEYPFLAKKIMNGDYEGVKYKEMSERGLIDLLKIVERKQHYFVTGEIGDQLTGSMITMRYPYEERNMLMKDVIATDHFCKPYTIPYRYKFTPILEKGKNGTEMVCEHIKDTIYEFLGTNESNTTLSEFLWGLNFIFKYMLVMLRLYQVGLYFEGEKKNTFHFFNTEKFQQWAMWNYKENCAYVKDTDYKMPFKEYIFEFTGDKEYRDNKLKEPSLKISWYYGEMREP